ncbi:EAL domain-containing protein [Novosphingobium sp. 9U]|uniref:bifunctional diguanylate cyclase/phosphodiesterase n=1 Tax=Novosphingobium sp. 9U TaxID=2653158 RepID=UPI00135C72B1|nr:EAL domain-containing protein [Novosphingobium sp. 9U]
MGRVTFVLEHQHNVLLVVVSVMVFISSCLVGFGGIDNALREPSQRRLCVALSAVATGFGIWASYFVGMLVYDPGVDLLFDVPTTILSACVPVGLAALGWTLALDRRPLMSLVGGSVIGVGAAGMPYLGTWALRMPAHIAWHHDLVAASIALSIGLAALAVWYHRRKVNAGLVAWEGGTLLTLAICSGDFLVRAAAEIQVPPAAPLAAAWTIDPPTLTILLVVVALVIMGAGIKLITVQDGTNRGELTQAKDRAVWADEILRGAEERERLTAELRRQVEITEAAIEHMPQGLSMYDADHRLVICNRRYGELHGIPMEMLKPGVHLADLYAYMVAEGKLTAVPEMSAQAAAFEPEWANQHDVKLPNGRIIEFSRCILPSGGWVATHEDVTDARKASEQIGYLAAHDTLTGLPNRVTFASNLEAVAKSGKPFALHTIDLDRFKEVNDTLGHPIGDHILKGAAKRLQRLVGASDIVTRLGGDEFAILQHQVDAQVSPDTLATSIVGSLSEPFQFEGHTVSIGASVGICRAPEHGSEGDDIMKKSDLALYRAKEESRGTYRFFEPGMDSRLSERRQLEADLKEAISAGQFEVHYQPLLDTTRNTIGSFEALVRWRHPTRGLLAPGEFIATAEESGLIIPIGEWVMRQACQDAASWPNDIKVAVNLSPAQFKRGDLIAMAMSALTAAGLPPRRLELEITESVLLHDEAWVQSTLEKLSALGISIAMDDFGTGYSSLSYLRSFPFNKIKIDRSFVADLINTSDALSIVQATIQLSKKLGMQITAEGVENAEQLDLLVAEGCTQVQGYHISRPIPAQEIVSLLTRYGENMGDCVTAAAA